MTKPQQQVERMLAFFESHGVTAVNVAALIRSSSGHTSLKHHDLERDVAAALKAMPWARAQNAAGHDIYMRPARYVNCLPASWPMVFLDDVPPTMAEAIADKYASCVIETSPGRCHVWIATKQSLDEAQRAAVQANLVQRLVALSPTYADPASTSGEHFGRCPGMKNWKRHGVWSNLRTISSGEPLDASEHLSKKENPRKEMPRVASLSSPQGNLAKTFVLNTSSAFSEPTARSTSEQEFGWAISYLRWWIKQLRPLAAAEQHVVAEVAKRALARGKRGTQAAAEAYARRTFMAAVATLDRI